MRRKRERRIGEGSDDADEAVDRDIRVLLHEIHGFYDKALLRLPVDKDPSLARRLRKAGFCFGTLDPVSNIIANTISYDYNSSPAEAEAEAKIITDTDDEDVFEIPLPQGVAQRMSVARRSLEGLVIFLTVQFRYLPEPEALRYLRLARADLLAAVWLIELDRHGRDKPPTFSFASSTTWVALRCAAVSASHPSPDAFVRATMSLVSRQDKVSKLLRRQHRRGTLARTSIGRLGRLFTREHKKIAMGSSELANNPWLPLSHASHRTGLMADNIWKPTWEVETGLPTSRCTQSLKLLLLNKIHDLYLSALRQLPRHELRNRHHCSLLKGGHCFGRSDPVTNIILNTLWYEAKFPPHPDCCVGFEVDLICTKLLMRLECCSLYGLVSLLRARVPSLTEHEAVWHLLISNAEVESAIHLARLHNQQDISCSSHEHSAYSEAAAQAWHPDPEGIADFIMSSEFCQLSMMVHGNNVHNFEFITKFLSEKKMQQTSEVLSKNQMKQTSQVLSQNQMKFVPKVHKKFQDDQEFFVRKVNAALKKYADENEESYVLHVICGVNPRVIQEPLKHGHFGRKAKFGYIHVNFLATPVARGARPVLFFAECSNKEEDEETSVCFQFGASICSMAAARCFHCELEGMKIVHPDNVSFHGLSDDFNEMALGEHSMCTELMISSWDFHNDMMQTMREDWIIFDPKVDANIAKKNPINDCARYIRRWQARIC